VSEHLQRRIGALPKPIQDIGWKAQVRLCKRFRRLVARGKHPNVAVTAIARELIAFMWVIASEVSITTSALTRMFHRKKRALRCDRLRLVLRPC
jgi:transposase